MSFKAQRRKLSSPSLLTRRRNVRRTSKLQEALLTVGAVLGSLCLLAALAGVLFGVKPLMFKSGSMEPTIPTGGLALSVLVDADDIRVGDIVSTGNAAGVRITHRVAAVGSADGFTALTLKGDANDVVDAETYAVTEVDRVFWSAPLLGYAVAWLSSPVALFLGGLLTAYLLYVAFASRARAGDDESDGADHSTPRSGRRALRQAPRRRKRELWRATSMAVSAGLVLAGGAFNAGSPAWAQFTDGATAHVLSGAGSLPAPGVTCENVTNGVRLKWTYQSLPVTPTFTVTWRSGNAAWSVWNNMTAVSAKEFSVFRSSFDEGILALGGNSAVQFRVQAQSGNWLSPYGTQTTSYTAPVKVLISLTPSSLRCA
ncbi:signal peptidase I [Arthrobacter sp.]|uniref:signal peptidase I n=1 Tax=Arthrobacter sp. TaxID=1667 RepID=UPI002812893B|nr:signal peptidase I [Arthrobacter sp.]